MAELDNALYERIGALSDAGDALMEDGDYEGALEKFWAGFDLLPEPKTNWEAGTWLMAAIGDLDGCRISSQGIWICIVNRDALFFISKIICTML